MTGYDNTRVRTVGATLGVSVVAALTLWTQAEVGDIQADITTLRDEVNAVSEIADDIALLHQEVRDISAVSDDLQAAINRAIQRAVRRAFEQANGS